MRVFFRLGFLVPVAVVLTVGVAHGVTAAQHTQARAVLVTGASSGIGRKITEVLAAEGHFVYAGARKKEDLEALNRIENVRSVRLDVTIQEEIDAAVELVRSEGRGLYGIVNNAGVAVFSPMNQTPEEDVRFVLDVNVLGPYRVNKAFAELIAESKGRTTTIGSISGFISGRSAGTYSMSKFAVEAYTDALAAELADSDIHVSVVEPGGYKSRIREKIARHAAQRITDSGQELTDEQKQRLEQVVASNESLKEPDEVAAAVLHALFSDEPKRRYMVTPNEQEAEMTIRAALGRVAELNADQPYSYDRDRLVEMLEEAIDGE